MSGHARKDALEGVQIQRLVLNVGEHIPGSCLGPGFWPEQKEGGSE